MQTLRKKSSPCKYKNEPSRFLGDGVSFKAKLIGILEVSEARGDRMCQEALADLKMAIRAAGEHKQRIIINIAIDGLRLRDEKTGDSLYHHPVHKISFIAQDMSDSRAFGYIFGSPDTGHRFFGIKTDKAASQVVIAMRDLFQVVFELKKKEIELAKQHIEQKSRFGSTTSTSIFATESSLSTTKSYQNGESHSLSSKFTSTEASASKTRKEESAHGGGNSEAIADLVDLELELSSIQQGIHQMERITPSDPFGPNKEDPFNNDPFGDSFINYPQKPFLPPPPPTGRERQNRIPSDTSSSLFSPKTPKTGDSTNTNEANLFKVSQDDSASCDWFSPTGSGSLFDDQPIGSSTQQEEQPIQQTAKTSDSQEIISPPSQTNTGVNLLTQSQIDVFTELDPLGTGRSKPYVDKKMFFQELKNPPKKVLKDLVSTQPQDTSLFTATFDNIMNQNSSSQNSNQNLFPSDPFAESDPFDKTDPFSENEFNKTCDPFDTDFIEDFKVFNKQEQNITSKTTAEPENIKLFSKPDQLQPLFPSTLSKSPNKTSLFKPSLNKSTFDLPLDKKGFEKSALDLDDSAPEPPPRPASNISPIKPPPLPPKKQSDTSKPPPRPPHTEESHYDYMESYETAPNSLDSTDIGPPLPVPARKSRFDQDFSSAPQRPKKNLSGTMSDEDYLTPVPPPLLPPQKKDSSKLVKDGILLPPPKRESKRNLVNGSNISQFENISQNKTTSQLSNIKTSNISDESQINTNTLDITLSQLTLSGLNELAVKLKIPPSQLSNMTLVQLTNYISNYVKAGKSNHNIVQHDTSNSSMPVFNADFPTNFDAFNDESTTESNTAEPYDRYAVFRELLQQEEMNKPTEVIESKENIVSSIEEEIKPAMQTSFIKDTIVEVIQEITPPKSTFQESSSSKIDRYAALRDIVIDDHVIEQKENNLEEDIKEEEEEPSADQEEAEQNDLNKESFINELETKEKLNDVENNIIPYETIEEKDEKEEKLNDENPIKSPVTITDTNVKSVVIDEPEVIQANNHRTSGSLSDAVTNSSPEMDNLAHAETVDKNNVENTAGESWAIFDTANIADNSARVQSEEGVSPWSSDSKEFGNGSPLDWQQRRDSESEGDWGRKGKMKGDNWWQSHSETKPPYEKQKHAAPYVRDRRSTDSYEDEWYEEEAQRRGGRRRRQPMWGRGTAEHSSSSRDVSPWDEDEPHNVRRDDAWQRMRSRDGRWDRLPRRDSWDEEDDYDYEDDYVSKYQYHTERHGSRDSDRGSRDSDRHSTPRGEPPDDWDRPVTDQWQSIDRKHAHRKNTYDDRWCRGEWDREDKSVFFAKDKRYGSRYSNTSDKWRDDRDRKRESDRYYKREHSQESPWEDEYSNDPDEPPQSPRYISASNRNRSWKRPSSASEMDRKTGEIKNRGQQPYYMGMGGSDGERDRRYKPSRRSRSRDSQFSEMTSRDRHKPDPGLTLRYPHRTSNREKFYSQKFDVPREVFALNNKSNKMDTKLESSNNKKSMMVSRKKGREMELPSPKTDQDMAINKNNRKQHLMFENDFVISENDSPISMKTNKFNFENDFETSEAESPTVGRQNKFSRTHTMFESDHSVKRNIRPSMKQTVDFDSEFSSKESRQSSKQLRNDFRDKDIIPKTSPTPRQHNLKQISMFEDDFSPTEKSDSQFEEVSNTVTVIPEEIEMTEQRVSFSENNLDRVPSFESRKHKHILNKTNRGASSRADNIKKSESVNIFARENDPFDDDFFKDDKSNDKPISSKKLGKNSSRNLNSSSMAGEFKWTEDFDSFDIPEVKNNE